MKSKKLTLQKPKLTPKEKRLIKSHREEIQKIVSGKDKRILLVIGPCSAWPKEAVVEYAKKLADLQPKVKDKIKLVMRVYTQKPRTSLGWKGVIYQPDPCADVSLKKAIKYIHDMMSKVTSLGLAIADEALFLPETTYFEDYLSYAAIGARSSEDQMHRNFAGTREYAVGIKNPTSGDLAILANSVLAAQNPSIFYAEGRFVQSEGNPYAHSVLRGGKKPNYSFKDFKQAVELQRALKINPRILIDTNHANSGKDPLKQPKIASSVLAYLSKNPEYKKYFLGFMVESFLQDGNQPIDCAKGIKKNGTSITDPVLGWEKTQKMVEDIYKSL